MNIAKLLSRPFLICTLLGSTALLTMPMLALAQGNSGLTIFSGVDRKDILDYYLQFGGNPKEQDRYKLYIPGKKLPQGASKFYISYPDNFKAEFKPENIEVRIKDGQQSVQLSGVAIDKESRFVEISLAESLPPNTKAEIVISNIKNPDFGTYYLVCDVLASGDIPVRLYVGTWIVSIQR